MNTNVILLLVSSVLIGCASLRDERAQLQDKLRTVNADDGITQSEAEIIAENYFSRFAPIACGSVTRPVDGGTNWIAKTYLGFASIETREPIRIDKQTGRVTWSDGPTITNASRIW